ncbi:MAG: hypothetical protein J6C50_04530 [Rickettsiales bacterium]|nr:hypothetical protein [Rickettsiales bacterium]
MLTEFFIKIPYLLYFIPLLGSLFINFISGKRFLTNCTYSILLILTLLAFKLIFHIDNYNDILIINSSNKYSVIGSEFKIGLYNVFILITILFVNFVGFANYIHEIVLNKKSDTTQIKHFFSIYLIYIFSTVGILMTTNIFHLFIFLEIYSFCMYMMVTVYKKHDLTVLSYKYFSNNIVGSILSMLTIFYIILYFNTSNMFVIKQQLITISIKDNIDIFLMFILFICSIVMKFFNTNTSKHYNTDNVGINFLSISNIFINTLLGIYLLNEVVYFIFGGHSIINLLYIDKLIIISTAIIIIYNSCMLFTEKYTNTVFSIFTRLNLINFGFLLLISLLTTDITMSLIFLIDFISIDMLLYFLSAYMSAKYGTNNISILNNNQIIKCFLIFIILFKLFLPIGTSLYTNKLFIDYVFNTQNTLLIIPFIISKIAMLFLLYQIISEKIQLSYNKDRILNKKYITMLLYSIILIFLFVIFLNIFIDIIDIPLPSIFGKN